MSAATRVLLAGIVAVACVAARVEAMEADPHAGHSMADAPLQPVPRLTDADRAAAALPDAAHAGHDIHDNRVYSFLRFDRLETAPGTRGAGVAWEGQGWVGTDVNRLWLRTQGSEGGDDDAAEVELLFGHSVARWWDVVGGVRRDQGGEGPARHYAGIGVLGLAPFSFEIEATAYVGDGGRTAARLAVEYQLLLTNRLIAEPLVEIDAYGSDDAARGVGRGLATIEAGLRLRYEFRRRFAPYVGVTWERRLGRTGDLAAALGREREDARIVAGLRTWF
jgi:copper resistance protein B